VPKRYDTGKVHKAELLATGWLKAPAHISRVGIQRYQRPDGAVQRELRRPEDVFHPDSLSSFAMVPVTLGHPPTLLDAASAATYQVGHMGEGIRQDGDKVLGLMLLVKQDAVEAVLDGVQQVSAGYDCDLDMTPGIWNGQPYDAIQKNIRGNHVALVARGRAGPDVRIHLDEADAVSVDVEENQEIQKGKHMTPEQIAALLKEQAEMKARLDSLTAALEQQKGRADSADALLQKEQKLRLDAESPARITALVAARVALAAKAAIIAPSLKMDELTDSEVRIQALEHFDSTYKESLKGRSAEYVQGVFETATRVKPEPSTVRVDVSDHFFTRTDGQKPIPDPAADFTAALEKLQERMR